MKVKIKISEKIEEPYAVIFTDKISDEIQKAVEILENQSNSIIILKNKEKIFVKSVEEIFLIQSENNQVVVFDKNENYSLNRKV